MDEHREQLALLRREVRKRRPPPLPGPAPTLPVATVAVDLPLAHLDRPFDYLVPEPMHDQAVPGCRVRVRFAGRDVDGYLLERRDASDHPGRLTPLRRVVSGEPVLRPAVLDVARRVADRYAGTLADVLRLAVPPRHARVEAEHAKVREPPLDLPDDRRSAPWAGYVGGPAWLRRLAAGDRPRAVWTAASSQEWPAALAAAAAATLASNRGSLLLAPDARDVARLDAAVTALLGRGTHVVLSADLGPAARYRAFLAVSRGSVPIVVGTRAAAFAPVADLGLVAIWDDGDDAYAEPRAPYPHAREVLLLRAAAEGTAALLGGVACSVESAALLESGWAASMYADRPALRPRVPTVHVTGETVRDLERDTPGVRTPHRVFDVVREALEHGPVLVSTPRYGYQPALACSRCREPARCAACRGPLARSRAGQQAAACRWCGTAADGWQCPSCGGQSLRAPVVGSLRTAEEWGRSFPQTRVVSSGGDSVVDAVDARPALVIATPGAEPYVEGGYAAAVLLDTWLPLGRPDLRATEEAVRRWFAVAGLVRGSQAGGSVVAVGAPDSPALQALVRWDPIGFARRELADRASAGLPPTVRLATMTGTPDQVDEALAALSFPGGCQVLGPVPVGDDAVRAVVKVPLARSAALSAALQRLSAARSSRKLPPVRVQVDPVNLG